MKVIEHTNRMKGVLCRNHPKKSGDYLITERDLDPKRWVRVIPETSRDIMWISNLVKNDERCAPAVHESASDNEGDGVFVNRSLLGKYVGQ
jgi:hypothetical protein